MFLNLEFTKYSNSIFAQNIFMMDTGKSQEFTSPVENGTGECVTGLWGGEYKT